MADEAETQLSNKDEAVVFHPLPLHSVAKKEKWMNILSRQSAVECIYSRLWRATSSLRSGWILQSVAFISALAIHALVKCKYREKKKSQWNSPNYTRFCYQNMLDEWQMTMWWFYRHLTNIMLLTLSRTSTAVFQLLLHATFHSLLLFRPSRGSCTLLYCSPCQNIHCCLYEVFFPTSLFEDYRCNKCHICLHGIGFGGGERNIWLCAFFLLQESAKKKEGRNALLSDFPTFISYICACCQKQ